MVSTSRRSLNALGTQWRKGLSSAWFWSWEDALGGWCRGRFTSQPPRRPTALWSQDIPTGLMPPVRAPSTARCVGRWQSRAGGVTFMGSVLVLHAFGGLWVVGSQPAGALLLFQWLPCAIFDTADERWVVFQILCMLLPSLNICVQLFSKSTVFPVWIL